MKKNIRKEIYSAVFLAIGMVLPMFTSQIKEIGDSLLPMHLPVMLCAFLCGGGYGAVIGFILPFFRSAVFGMPPLFPNALWMACEMATYGAVIGLMYGKLKFRGTKGIYFSLITSMLAGRIVWGIVKAILFGLSGKSFAFYAFLTGGFLDAFPGIILQLLLIPFIITVAEKHKSRM